MNWVIRKSNKILYHTHLNEILEPIIDEVKNYNWILADIEHGGSLVELPINMDEEYCILTPDKFDVILKADVQFYWGVILGIPANKNITIDENNIPFAEGNEFIWKNDNIQYPDAEIEIVCFDSGYTIVKFKSEPLSNQFRAYFPEAIELEKLLD
ncbi:MAG: hypothetical protein ABIN91_14910 [Mucilaginibacter sp.]|uniref:hypothetical protein n=1 Tax=Mucilaginibacter sp. TaxID=1882438 RepID=UPI0032676686